MKNHPTPYIFVSVAGNYEKFKELSENDFEKLRKYNRYLRNFEHAQGLISLVKNNAIVIIQEV